jgi:hypothetical protein
MEKKQAKFPYGLPQIIAVLNLISDVFLTRVCAECGWNDDDLEYYKAHSDHIPVSDRGIINNIVKDQLQYLLKNCPQLSPLQ